MESEWQNISVSKAWDLEEILISFLLYYGLSYSWLNQEKDTDVWIPSIKFRHFSYVSEVKSLVQSSYRIVNGEKSNSRGLVTSSWAEPVSENPFCLQRLLLYLWP